MGLALIITAGIIYSLVLIKKSIDKHEKNNNI